MNILLAVLAAVLVQPLVFLARLAPDLMISPGPVNGIGLVLIMVLVVSALVVLLLGLPAFLLIKRFGRLNRVSVALAGVLLGALPAAFSWPSQVEGYSAGRNWHGNLVETYVDGVPTSYAWLIYGEGIVFFALHGLIAALVFYAVWRRRERTD